MSYDSFFQRSIEVLIEMLRKDGLNEEEIQKIIELMKE